MNMRANLLRAALANPGATLQEIADAIGEKDVKRVRNNIDAAIHDNLLSRGIDEVTGQPGYRITVDGRMRLSALNGGDAVKANRSKKASGETPATAPSSGTDSDGGEADVHPAPEPQYDPRAVSFNHAERAAAAQEDVIALMQIIGGIRAAIGDDGRIMLGDLAREVKDRIDGAGEFSAKAKETEAAIKRIDGELSQAQAQRDASNREVERLRDELSGLNAAVDSLRADYNSTGDILGELTGDFSSPRALWELADEVKQKFEALRHDLAEARDVKKLAKGYLVKAPKRKPRILKQDDRAAKAATAAARNGSGRGEVYALVHIGTARRSAVYQEAK